MKVKAVFFLMALCLAGCEKSKFEVVDKRVIYNGSIDDLKAESVTLKHYYNEVIIRNGMIEASHSYYNGVLKNPVFPRTAMKYMNGTDPCIGWIDNKVDQLGIQTRVGVLLCIDKMPDKNSIYANALYQHTIYGSSSRDNSYMTDIMK